MEALVLRPSCHSNIQAPSHILIYIRYLTIIAFLWIVPIYAPAQFLRLGPFDFSAKTFLRGDYTTNVEDEWPDQATGEMTDYYITTGIDFLSKATVLRKTQLDIESSFAIEKHFKRPDLDNESNPFGRLQLSTKTDLSPHLALIADGYVRRESQSAKDVYVPGDLKTRDISDQLDYKIGLNFQRKSLRAMTAYSYHGERHQDQQFAFADEDRYTTEFGVNWQPLRIAGLYYTFKNEVSKELNNTDADDDRTTEEFGLSGQIPLMKKPRISYSLGMKKIDDNESDGPIKPTHTLSIDDDWRFPTIKLSVYAQYKYQDEYENDDIAFTYGALLEHQLARTVQQTLSARKKPVRILGTTAKSDNTTIRYEFMKRDLFVYFLNMKLGVEFIRDTPIDESSPTEDKWLYFAHFEHRRELSRKINRVVRYEVNHEVSNLQMEAKDEHRITLIYEYTF